MDKLLFCLLTLTVLTFTSSLRIDGHFDDEVDRGNDFIDKLIKDMMHEHGYEYDPYYFEDSVIGFNKKVLFVNVTGEAKLHRGYVSGLSSLHRPDYCKVREEDDRLKVSADLGAGVIKCHYDGTVKFMNFGPTISINGVVKYIEIHMEFSVDSKTGRDGVLDEFTIDDMKGMSVEISGLGPMNWAVNYLISGVTSLFKGFLKSLLEKKVRNHLAERLPNYQFPVDDITTTELPETEVPTTQAPPEEAVAYAEELLRDAMSNMEIV